MAHVLRFASLLVVLTFSADFAHADIAPPGGETCTEERVQQAGAQGCVTCRGHFQTPEACREVHSETKTLACRSTGATVWNEFWCDQPGDMSTLPPRAPSGLALGEQSPRGCTCRVSGGASGATMGLSLLVLGLLLARRRR